MIRVFLILLFLIGCSDKPKAPKQSIPQLRKISFEGVNLLPFDVSGNKTTNYKSLSFLGGTWYIAAIDCSKINSPMKFVEEKYLEKKWLQSSLKNSIRKWNFPLDILYIDDEHDLFFNTKSINAQFGATVRVSHRAETQELFFYITLPK